MLVQCPLKLLKTFSFCLFVSLLLGHFCLRLETNHHSHHKNIKLYQNKLNFHLTNHANTEFNVTLIVFPRS